MKPGEKYKVKGLGVNATIDILKENKGAFEIYIDGHGVKKTVMIEKHRLKKYLGRKLKGETE